MRRRTIVTTTALFLCTTSALTACSSGTGSGSAKDSAAAKAPASATPAAATPATAKDPFAGRSAGQIFNDAMEENLKAPSLRLKADTTDAKDGPTQVDAAMDVKGDCTGTLRSGKDTITMIKAGKTVYVRPAGAHTWTKVPTSTADGKSMAQVCDLNGLLDTPDRRAVDTSAKKGATTTVDGHPALVLTSRDGQERDTAYVATTGKHYLLKLVSVGGDDPGTLEFSDFGRPVHAVAPPKSQIAAG
ncbi:hypothetical protein OG432_20515 [Streptomyces sp. NBC_00442]|uniref:hypothetical protein n=1 Tax=Streptomyces sp. NBC_00442 TaxID=2903651 RepID=UPI002E1B5F6A